MDDLNTQIKIKIKMSRENKSPWKNLIGVTIKHEHYKQEFFKRI